MKRIVLISLLLSAPLCRYAGAQEPDTTAVWQLPKDSLATRPYNGHFSSDEVLKSDPALAHSEFSTEQNLLGESRSTRLDNGLYEEEFTVFFRRNRTDIDPRYLWNPQQLGYLRDFLGSRRVVVDTVTVYAFASPEGHAGHNVWLSRERARAARTYLLQHSSLDPTLVRISGQEENWSGLRQAVNMFYSRQNRSEVLEILSDRSLTAPQSKQRLMELDGGKTYEYLIDTLMPPLRSAIFSIRYSQRETLIPLAPVAFSAPLLSVPQTSLASRTIPSPEPVWTVTPTPEWAKRTIVAFKTNALYDMATALNYSVEIPFGSRFSIAWQHYFPWWHTEPKLKYCLQYLTLGGEARWWFAPRTRPETDKRQIRDALVGHFVGVYGLWGKTDLQWGRSVGMYQCFPVVSAGLTYGYSMPVSKRWNLELSVSAGYARIPYQHYIPSEDWTILWRDRDKVGVLHYWGPTNVAVTLVRPIVIKYRVR